MLHTVARKYVNKEQMRFKVFDDDADHFKRHYRKSGEKERMKR